MYGKAMTELALAFGADDIDGTIDDTIEDLLDGRGRRPEAFDEHRRHAPHRPGGRLPRRGTRYLL